MNKPYQALRDLIAQQGMTVATLAAKLDVNRSTLSRKLNGHAEWTNWEMWEILHILHVPPRRMHIIFPRCGAAPSRRTT